MRSWEEGKNFFSREKRFFPSPQTPLPFSRKAVLFEIYHCPIPSEATRRGVVKRRRKGEFFRDPPSGREKKFSLSPAPPFSFKKSGIFLDDRSCPAVRKNFCSKKCRTWATVFACGAIEVNRYRFTFTSESKPVPVYFHK